MQNLIQLTDNQKADLLRANQTLEQLQAATDDLEACGEDCQLRKLKISNLRKQISELLSRFGGVFQ